MSIRKPAVAGTFYPSSKEELKKEISSFLANAPDTKIDGKIKAILVPHAGYIYSGQVAAYAYKLIKNTKQKRIIILGPSHTTYITDPVCDENEAWQTPLGSVNIAKNNFPKNKEAHLQEHCLEVQIPFLQTIKDKFEIIPLVVGDTDPQLVAKEIQTLLDDNTLLVISTDLSHFHDYNSASELDKETVRAIRELEPRAIEEACGEIPIRTVICLAQSLKWKVKELIYKNSGDVTGDKGRVVGYTSFVFYK